MKIELIKETGWDGKAKYSVEVNGHYQSGTITYDLEMAEMYYSTILESSKEPKATEIIKSETI